MREYSSHCGEPLPNVTLHFLLADRVLDGRGARSGSAPFSIRDPAALNAFRQGALGPDMGYFPGGHRFLSDLAHCVRSGDLCRALMETARTRLERAFAAGWLTHVLGDALIHPWVGRGVGALREGDPHHFVSGDRDPVGHLRVETGLDAFYSHRFPDVRRQVTAPVFNGASVAFLARAFRVTYGVRFDRPLLLASHHTTARMSARALHTIGVLGDAQAARSRSRLIRAARRGLEKVGDSLRRGTGQDLMLLALLTPVPPAEWLLEGVEEVLEGFSSRFRECWETGGATLENRNLDTGEPDRDCLDHGGRLMALGVLARCGGAASTPPSWDPEGEGVGRYPGAAAPWAPPARTLASVPHPATRAPATAPR